MVVVEPVETQFSFFHFYFYFLFSISTPVFLRIIARRNDSPNSPEYPESPDKATVRYGLKS
jgi:hypothetical protein